MKKGKVPAAVPRREYLLGELADPAFAAAYLNFAAKEKDPAAFLQALRNVVDASGGIAEIAEFARARIAEWYSTCHFLNNQLIELDHDEAQVETYAYITRKATAEGQPTLWAHGARRFVDHMVRRDDTWLVAERRVVTNRIEDPGA